MSDCIFCRIGAGEIPGTFLYRDDEVFAIRDIHPVAPSHILIITKAHIPTLNDAGSALVGRMVGVAQELARQESVAEKGYRLVVNVGPEAGQEVLHLHLHLIGGRPLGRMA
ncbi:MAG: histidine triad nucleotide-binding protein [Chloroflexi bacterium]|nr:histidine triad nucleotide-binding protein [Chloroflexota bacterium]